MCGLVNMVGMIGAVFGENIMSHIIGLLTWRQIIMYLSLCGGIIAILITLFVKDFPFSDHPSKTHSEITLVKTPILKNLSLIVTKPQVWFISLYVATLHCSFDTLAALWGIPYLQGIYNLFLTKATSIASTIFIGGIFGFLFFGFVTTNTQNKNKIITLISAGIVFICSLIINIQPNSIAIVQLLLFILGFCAGSLSTATDLLKSQMPHDISGLAIGVLNLTLVTIGALSQPLFGYLLQKGHASATTLNTFHVTDFHRAFILMLCLFAVSVICALFTKQVNKAKQP